MVARKRITDDKILVAFRQHKGNKSATGRALGISHGTVRKRLLALDRKTSAASADLLWALYLADGRRNIERRNQLVEIYLPLARKMAKRYLLKLPPNANQDAICSAAYGALIRAVEKFDPYMGFKFSTFAGRKIQEAMIDSVREWDYVPRLSLAKAAALKGAVDELATNLGRKPTQEEVESVVGGPQVVREGTPISFSSMEKPLPCPVPNKDRENDLRSIFPAKIIKADSAGEFGRLTDALPFRARVGLYLYFFCDVTMKEISKLFGVSESRISQMFYDARQSLARRWTREEMAERIINP